MKHSFLLVFLIISFTGDCQDTIWNKKGSFIIGNITDSTSTKITFNRTVNNLTRSFTFHKKKIEYIKWGNGNIDSVAKNYLAYKLSHDAVMGRNYFFINAFAITNGALTLGYERILSPMRKTGIRGTFIHSETSGYFRKYDEVNNKNGGEFFMNFYPMNARSQHAFCLGINIKYLTADFSFNEYRNEGWSYQNLTYKATYPGNQLAAGCHAGFLIRMKKIFHVEIYGQVLVVSNFIRLPEDYFSLPAYSDPEYAKKQWVNDHNLEILEEKYKYKSYQLLFVPDISIGVFF
ncbi:MAG: hypothetical protein ACOZCO_01005 [Bacteroidota bacterium]